MYKTGSLTAEECLANCTFTPSSVDVIEGKRIQIVHDLFCRDYDLFTYTVYL